MQITKNSSGTSICKVRFYLSYEGARVFGVPVGTNMRSTIPNMLGAHKPTGFHTQLFTQYNREGALAWSEGLDFLAGECPEERDTRRSR